MSEKYYVDFNKLPKWMTHDMAKRLIFDVADSVGLPCLDRTGVNYGYEESDGKLMHHWNEEHGKSLLIFDFCEWLSKQGSAKKVEKTAVQRLRDTEGGEMVYGSDLWKAILEIADKVGL